MRIVLVVILKDPCIEGSPEYRASDHSLSQLNIGILIFVIAIINNPLHRLVHRTQGERALL
jgi:hypothetical protein